MASVINITNETPTGFGEIFKPTNKEEVRTTSATGGVKGSKPERFDLIPPGPMKQLARLYGNGAGKYDDHNWARGYDWGLSFAAAQRHMWAFWNGEDIDEEMQVPHVICAIFHMMTLSQFLEEHPEYDNRMVRRKYERAAE